MKKFILSMILCFCSLWCVSQTVVSHYNRIKNTRIEWTVSGSDTVYIAPVTDFSSPIPETVFLRFCGSKALISTYEWLANAEVAKGDMVRLDNTIDKNVISRFSKNFASGYLLFNKEYELPTSVFWMKKLIKEDYKHIIKHFSDDKPKEKHKSKSNDDMYN